MPLFIGMVPVCLAVACGAYWHIARPEPFIAASAIYIVGVFGVTAACNVPMNKALATLDPASTEALHYWRALYLPQWTAWNSVRTVACLLASAVLLYGVTSHLAAE